ncbi:hypothetical protein HDF14_002250 [Edaphobacter lichenicola]|uniref:Uncharacterized protein n=1 Tax=Tunturiibacter gelidiferens TaxID=3069689 RepID=A0A9X0QE17_9BACT|nr:hypothetical protein [Edaphobacter lichenicola]
MRALFDSAEARDQNVRDYGSFGRGYCQGIDAEGLKHEEECDGNSDGISEGEDAA